MVDADLAVLYDVDVKVLNQAVKRNMARFPNDFMFRLTAEESLRLRSQIVTLKRGRGQHRKYLPHATPNWPSSLRRSSKNTTPSSKIVFDAIRELMTPPKTERKRIGFEVRERRPRYGRSADEERHV